MTGTCEWKCEWPWKEEEEMLNREGSDKGGRRPQLCNGQRQKFRKEPFQRLGLQKRRREICAAEVRRWVLDQSKVGWAGLPPWGGLLQRLRQKPPRLFSLSFLLFCQC